MTNTYAGKDITQNLCSRLAQRLEHAQSFSPKHCIKCHSLHHVEKDFFVNLSGAITIWGEL